MMFSNRTLLAVAGLAVASAVGCGGSITAPSGAGATISGTLDPGTSFGTSGGAGLTGAAAGGGWSVAIVGTDLSVTVDGSGNFQLNGVPEGDVLLSFSNGLVTATVSVSRVGRGEVIRIEVIILGDTAAITNEKRTAGKVQLCHLTGTGTYLPIEISGNAEPAHRAHGDGAVGERVPADPTKVFNSACRPIPRGVSIEKSTNGEDADQAPGPSIQVGSAVTWRYVVTNTSTGALTNVAVSDDRGVVVNCGGQTTLAAGQQMTCTGAGVAAAGQYKNVGTVTATSIDGPASYSDPSHYFGVPPTQNDGTGDGTKVQLCHRTGAGFYVLIEVGASAEPDHRAHGDARPGEAVPNGSGKRFSASCTLQ